MRVAARRRRIGLDLLWLNRWTTLLRFVLLGMLVMVPFRQGAGGEALAATLFGGVLVRLAVTDLQRGVIPNRIVVPSILAALIAATLLGDERSHLSGGSVALVVMLLIELVSRDGLGGGDVKMAGLAGVVVGYPAILFAGTVVFLAGGFVALTLLASGRASVGDALPYGPFITLGTLASLLR